MSGNDPDSGAQLKTSIDEFDTLRDAHAEIIQQFPAHPQSQEVMNRLLDAATREGLVRGEAPIEELMYQFPADNLGLMLLDQEYDRLSKESSEKASAFLRRVQERASEDAIGLRALDKALEQIRRESPERFLASCSDLIDDGQSDKAARVALHKRMWYYADVGQVKFAALDALRFWASYPDVVERMNLQIALATRMRNSGLHIEADMLDQSASPDVVARTLLEEFRTAKVGQDAAGRRLSFSEAYFQFAPDLASTLQASPADGAYSFEKALFHARLGRIAISQLEGDRAMDLYGKYLEQVDNLLDTARIDTDSLLRVETVHKTSFDALIDLFGENGFLRDKASQSEYRLGSINETRFLAQFSQASVQISSAIAEKTTSLDSSTYAAILDRHIEFLKSLNSRKQVTDAYNDFVAQFPSSQEAPTHLMMLADFYEDISNVPTKAQQTYARVVEHYPHSSEAKTAGMKICLLLYESEKYEEAFEKLREFQAAYPASNQVVTAKFLSALCEAAMGLSDEAEEHMRDLVRGHHQHTIAARALFWLGSASLSKQDYGGARDTFLDLMERYPESEYANRAREYVARLSTIAE